MTVVAAPDPEMRALHDRLEGAYLTLLAQAPLRHFRRERAGYVLVGFAGLASPSMNRVASVSVEPDRIGEMLEDAQELFTPRALPWCVHVTPFTAPADLEARLTKFRLLTELSVMVRREGAHPPRAPRDRVSVREVPARDLATFMSVTLETFSMSKAFFPGLLDITRGWVEAGARAYLAFVEDEVVGCGMLTRSEGIGGVYNVGTRSAFRDRGVASAILARVFDDHAEMGGGPLTLQVARDAPAEKLYRELGFERVYGWRLLVPRRYV